MASTKLVKFECIECGHDTEAYIPEDMEPEDVPPPLCPECVMTTARKAVETGEVYYEGKKVGV
jgi:NAD-dependent SIR2 family protein deacetylase